MKTEFSIVNSGVGGLALCLATADAEQTLKTEFSIAKNDAGGWTEFSIVNSDVGGLALCLATADAEKKDNFHLPTAVFRK